MIYINIIPHICIKVCMKRVLLLLCLFCVAFSLCGQDRKTEFSVKTVIDQTAFDLLEVTAGYKIDNRVFGAGLGFGVERLIGGEKSFKGIYPVSVFYRGYTQLGSSSRWSLYGDAAVGYYLNFGTRGFFVRVQPGLSVVLRGNCLFFFGPSVQYFQSQRFYGLGMGITL